MDFEEIAFWVRGAAEFNRRLEEASRQQTG